MNITYELIKGDKIKCIDADGILVNDSSGSRIKLILGGIYTFDHYTANGSLCVEEHAPGFFLKRWVFVSRPIKAVDIDYLQLAKEVSGKMA